MTLRAVLASVLIVLTALVPMPVCAQEPPAAWRLVVDSLPPQAMVTVRLADGTRVKGRLMEVTMDTLVIQRQTRLRVAPTVLDAEDVRSVSYAKEGTSPGGKVVMVLGGIAVACGAVFVAVLASIDY